MKVLAYVTVRASKWYAQVLFTKQTSSIDYIT